MAEDGPIKMYSTTVFFKSCNKNIDWSNRVFKAIAFYASKNTFYLMEWAIVLCNMQDWQQKKS